MAIFFTVCATPRGSCDENFGLADLLQDTREKEAMPEEALEKTREKGKKKKGSHSHREP
jgi:hypothetical protein